MTSVCSLYSICCDLSLHILSLEISDLILGYQVTEKKKQLNDIVTTCSYTAFKHLGLSFWADKCPVFFFVFFVTSCLEL